MQRTPSRIQFKSAWCGLLVHRLQLINIHLKEARCLEVANYDYVDPAVSKFENYP
jgi:hypothetical protein